MLTLAALLFLAAGPAPERFPAGVMVEKVLAGAVGDIAGVRSGDVLLSWSRANGPAGAGSAEEAVHAFSLGEITREPLLRGPVAFRVARAGQLLTLVVPWEGAALGLKARPAFPPDLLALYERGGRLAGE